MRALKIGLLAVTVIFVALIMGGLVLATWPVHSKLMFHSPHRESDETVRALIQNGRPVNPARYYPDALLSDGDAQCSATLVGRDAMLTAAHCVRASALAASLIPIEVGERRGKGVCEPSPTQDIALCKVSPEIDNLAFDPFYVKTAAVNDEVTLTGWAEQPSRSWFHRAWDRLVRRVGFANSFREGTGQIRSIGQTLLVDGAMTPDGPVVANVGDSGGAAYITPSGPRGTRWVIGVIVCGGTLCRSDATVGTTEVENLTGVATETWIRCWMRRTGATVSGFTPADDATCHKAK